MSEPQWVLYGATGYTGALIIEEAIARGHRPLLAGRSPEKLAALGAKYGLAATAAALDNPSALARLLEGKRAVLHAAGPFCETSKPMLAACLAAKASYLDITGELDVLESVLARDGEAVAAGVTLVPGVGFDVVPTDCLARFVAGRVEGATDLDIAFHTDASMSAGTARSAMAQQPRGGMVRRNKVLVPWALGRGVRTVQFLDGPRPVMPIPWGDLETAWHSTGVLNITTYAAVPQALGAALKVLWPAVGLGQKLAGLALKSKGVQELLAGRQQGSSAQIRSEGKSQVWARASGPGGAAEAWLETQEAYAFTAAASVRAVEQVLAHPKPGAHTPAQAFGADFVLTIPRTRRQG